MWGLFFGLAAMVAFAAASVQAAGIVDTNLLLHFDAADADGDGVAGLGAGTTWANKAGTGATFNGGLYVNAGHPGIMPAWAGSGTVADPYTLQFREPGAGDNRASGFVAVDNTYTAGNALDIQTYTYESWVKIARPEGGGSDLGTFISHNTNAAGQGNSVLAYNVSVAGGGVIPGLVPEGLWYQGGGINGMALPNSSGVAALSGYHHVVLARAGGGATDTAWYLDGVLQGTFQTDSGPSVDAYLTIGARSWNTLEAANFLDTPNADIAVVRVYGAALSAADVSQNFAAERSLFVPEPGTIALLVTGAMGLVCYAWRKRK